MMALPHVHDEKPLRMSEAEYLAFEEKSAIRHEFANGKVYAMAGAEWEHVMIVQSTSAALYAQLRGKNCRVAANDLRLKVTSKTVSYRYPDIMVICGEPNFIENRQIIDNPTLIIEVLSPSTALEDRNAKLDEYRSIASVQDYLLVSVDAPKVEIFSRFEGEKWLYAATRGLDASVDLPSIACKLALADVYEQVKFTNDEAP